MPKDLSAPARSRARADLMRIYAAAVAAVAPRRVMEQAFAGVTAGSANVPMKISRSRGVRLLAIGKAATGMAAEAERLLDGRLIEGLVIAPPAGGAAQAVPLRSRVMHASHPLPDASSLAAARAALDFVARSRPGELVLLALSGGASALAAAPAGAVTLADKAAISSGLMRAGATIRELNTVRKHLSAIKGGRLLAAAPDGVEVLSLILSDVPGNDLATIGSGPTESDPTSYGDAISVLKRRGLWGRAPEAIRDHLERGAAGEFDETVKPGDARLGRVTNVIVGDNRTAVDAAAAQAAALGYQVERGEALSGEADELGGALARRLCAITGRRTCVVAGGEPVVTVRGDGRGGRAQQSALAFAIELDRLERGRSADAKVIAMFAGTDGIDGPTDAAGAIAANGTIARAAEAQIDPHAALGRNDAYRFFEALGDLVIIGPTGTNVADIFVGLVGY